MLQAAVPSSGMNEIAHIMRDLPNSGLVPLMVLIVAGLVLWAVGRKLLRVAFVLAGVVVGGIAGLIVSESLHIGMPLWAGGLAGSLLLAILAIVAYRIAAAVSLAALFALAVPLGVLTVSELQHRSGVPSLATDAEANQRAALTLEEMAALLNKYDEPEMREHIAMGLDAAKSSVKDELEALNEKFGLSEKAQQHIEQVRAFFKRVLDAGKAEWEKTPESLRPMLTIAALLGGLLGGLMGVLTRNFADSAVAAMGGSILWLSGAWTLAARFGFSEGPWMPASSMAWLAVWLITTAIGVVIQFRFHRSPADKNS